MDPDPTIDGAANLRKLIGTEEPLVCLGVFDGHSAKLAERCGAKTLYAGGYAASAVQGLSDNGLLTRADRVAQLNSITRATDLPVIADADTGWGGPAEVALTVAAFEAAGVAGVQIEDQICAKRCGSLEGKQVVKTEEMVAKIAAAASARLDPSLVLIARTDALQPMGLAEAVARCRAYAGAGADALLVDAADTLEQVVEIGRLLGSLGLPLVHNAAPTGKAAVVAREDLIRAGFRVVLHPVEPLLAAHVAMAEAMRDVLAGRICPADEDGERFKAVSRFLAPREVESRSGPTQFRSKDGA